MEEVRENASQLHRDTYTAIRALFPLAKIHQEYPIRINGQVLFIDIFIEKPFKIAFECHGEQHFRYVSHFHNSPWDFYKQKRHDGLKSEWCSQNGVLFVEITYKDKVTPELIQQRIDEAIEREEGLD